MLVHILRCDNCPCYVLYCSGAPLGAGERAEKAHAAQLAALEDARRKEVARYEQRIAGLQAEAGMRLREPMPMCALTGLLNTI